MKSRAWCLFPLLMPFSLPLGAGPGGVPAAPPEVPVQRPAVAAEAPAAASLVREAKAPPRQRTRYGMGYERRFRPGNPRGGRRGRH